MPHFSRTSVERLNTCHEDLQFLFKEIIEEVDCTILEGHRGQGAQDAAVAAGRWLTTSIAGNSLVRPDG